MSKEIDPVEKSFKRRKDIIKNVAIIFLAVLLVLTFFSNTIMNYSLPQVAVQYVQSGTITSKIRGTGTVTSGDPYNVMVKQSRTVSSIHIRKGAEVKKGDLLISLAEEDSEELDGAKQALESAQKAYEKAVLSSDVTSSDIAAAQNGFNIDSYRNQITAMQQAVKAAEVDVDKLQKEYDEVSSLNNLAGLNKISAAERTELENLNQAALAAKSAMDLAKATYEQVLSDNGGDLTNQDVIDANAVYQAKSAEYTAANKKYVDKVADIQKREDEFSDFSDSVAIRLINAAANLATVKETLTDKQKNLDDLVATYARILNLRDLLDAISDAQDKVTKLAQDNEGYEVLAPINGTVISVNVESGKNTNTVDPVVVLQPEGQGYYLTFAVDNEQAKMISVGDRAEVANTWWYSNVFGTIASIKPDAANPQKSKMVTINLEGDLVDGQSLTMAVASRTSDYDMIVPNSALHEDNNGKFVLVVKSKPSPLGNRYFATRYDVEVLASDDTQTAVKSTFDAYEYVITTSTKPISAGDQVRLSES